MIGISIIDYTPGVGQIATRPIRRGRTARGTGHCEEPHVDNDPDTTGPTAFDPEGNQQLECAVPAAVVGGDSEIIPDNHRRPGAAATRYLPSKRTSRNPAHDPPVDRQL